MNEEIEVDNIKVLNERKKEMLKEKKKIHIEIIIPENSDDSLCKVEKCCDFKTELKALHILEKLIIEMMKENPLLHVAMNLDLENKMFKSKIHEFDLKNKEGEENDNK